jgi:hypothetical protein
LSSPRLDQPAQRIGKPGNGNASTIHIQELSKEPII